MGHVQHNQFERAKVDMLLYISMLSDTPHSREKETKQIAKIVFFGEAVI